MAMLADSISDKNVTTRPTNAALGLSTGEAEKRLKQYGRNKIEQLLFINLITDVLPALALGMTPGDNNIMKAAPNKSGRPIIDNTQWKAVLFYSVVISAASLGAVLTNHFLFHETEGWNLQLCNNILFFHRDRIASAPCIEHELIRDKILYFRGGQEQIRFVCLNTNYHATT